MKRNFYTILTILALLLLSAEPWAAALKVDDQFKVNGITYVVTNTNPLEVSVGGGEGVAIDKGTTGAIVIPDAVKGPDNNEYSVTDIGAGAFRECKGLTSVVLIPNGKPF